MHWIDRGPEPDGLETVREARTGSWVVHYRDGIGNRPNDSRWQHFHDDLSAPFHGLCAYCEETTPGEVDHFRPVSRFPHLVYKWSNWVFACHYCNSNKSNRCPSGGYVDPCAGCVDERPERYFTFDVEKRELKSRAGLPAIRRQRAAQMMTDLKLNALHHLKHRLWLLDAINFALERFDENTEGDWAFLEKFIDRASPLSSFARGVLEARGFEIDD